MVRGKTTLFKVICDELDYDSGDIFKNKSLKIGYVEQFLLQESNRNVFEELLTIKQNKCVKKHLTYKSIHKF